MVRFAHIRLGECELAHRGGVVAPCIEGAVGRYLVSDIEFGRVGLAFLGVLNVPERQELRVEMQGHVHIGRRSLIRPLMHAPGRKQQHRGCQNRMQQVQPHFTWPPLFPNL